MPAVELASEELVRRLAPLGVRSIRRLTGGASSLTYAATKDDATQVVVKVAPAGVAPVLNRDVLRQARLMRALAGTGVPVPEVLWEDAGDPPDVPPLFVTSFVEGASLEPLYDADGEEDLDVVAARLRAAALAMRALHDLRPGDLGLGGEGVVGLPEEVDRWCRLLETVEPALVPDWQQVAANLRASEPVARRPAIVHGDLRLGNMLADGPVISAVIDWEIWSVGDPRVDVGWFLINADPATYRRSTRYAGLLPPPGELAALYGDVPDLGWFEALACFKSTATWALIVKHNRRRPAPDPALAEMATMLPQLLRRAALLL